MNKMLNKTMRALIVLLCYLVLTTNGGNAASKGSNGMKWYGRLCGKRLPEAIRVICQGGYAQNDQPINTIPPEYHRYEVFITVQRARAMLKMNRMKRYGIVNECCEKACSFEELSEYCLNPY